MVTTSAAVALAGALGSYAWITESTPRATVVVTGLSVGTGGLAVLLAGYALSWRLGLRAALQDFGPRPAVATAPPVVAS